jgi:hypothetical protein
MDGEVRTREFDCLFYTGSSVSGEEPHHYELSLTSVGLEPVHVPFKVDKW